MLGCSICWPYWHQHHPLLKTLSWPRIASVTGFPRPVNLIVRTCYSSGVRCCWGVPGYFIPPAFRESRLQHHLKWGKRPLEHTPIQLEIGILSAPPPSQAGSITHVPLPAPTDTRHRCLTDLLHWRTRMRTPHTPRLIPLSTHNHSRPTWLNCRLKRPSTHLAACLCLLPDTKTVTGVPRLNIDAPSDPVHSSMGDRLRSPQLLVTTFLQALSSHASATPRPPAWPLRPPHDPPPYLRGFSPDWQGAGQRLEEQERHATQEPSPRHPPPAPAPPPRRRHLPPPPPSPPLPCSSFFPSFPVSLSPPVSGSASPRPSPNALPDTGVVLQFLRFIGPCPSSIGLKSCRSNRSSASLWGRIIGEIQPMESRRKPGHLECREAV